MYLKCLYITYGTQTSDGTKAWDTFMSLVATTRKLGVIFFEYVRALIIGTENIDSLATMIQKNTALNLWVGRGRWSNCLPQIID